MTPQLFKNHKPRLLSESQKRNSLIKKLRRINSQDPKNMIICAGLPKTGSKSCSAALRKLGQDIQMYRRNHIYTRVWVKYLSINSRLTIFFRGGLI